MKNVLFKNYYFLFLSGISILLIIVSFLLPPLGSIDPSVLTAVGELFGWAALATVIKALDKGVDAHIQKGDVSIDIENDDNKE